MSIAQLDEIRSQIQAQVKAHTPTQKVYNPSPEFVTQPVNGLIYTLPPNGFAKQPWEKQGRHYDGILVIEDQYGISEEARKKAKAMASRKGMTPRQAVAALRPDKRIASALDVVAHIVAKLGKRGVIWLSGDEERDEQAKKDADARWAEFEYETAQSIVNNYNNRTAAFHRIPQNAGKLPPSMTDREIRAQETIDAWHEGRASRFEFVCKYRDGYGTNEKEKIERHYRVAHSGVESAEEQAPVVTPKRRGRPPKVQAVA